FFHYATGIGSHDSLQVALNTFNVTDNCGLAPGGWSTWLRSDALKYFIEITDDDTNSNYVQASQFDPQLLALSPTQFGTAANRNYVFHSIVGLLENSPPLSPWLANQPLVTPKCTTNNDSIWSPGTDYQSLSRLTGGLRYPICEYQNFNAIFQDVAT